VNEPNEESGTESRWSRRDVIASLGVGVLGVAGVGYGFARAGAPGARGAAALAAGEPSPGAASPGADAGAASGAADPLAAGTADPNPFGLPVVSRVAGEPTGIPGPITRRRATTVRETLVVREAVAEIEPGVTFPFMTFDGQVPGRMIRARQGDEIHLRIENPAGNRRLHNVDLHAVYGPGGGAKATKAGPGEANEFVFQARYPGAFVYHCAIPNMDMHISCGMFGLIVVEPPEGLPAVDREFYVGQHEVYTQRETGEEGPHHFSPGRMKSEDPTYVLLNGAKYGLTGGRHGPMEARVGETVRLFFANGGPNLTSSFHPIGSVFSRMWREGAVMSQPERWVQTASVPPGSTLVAEMELEVPGPVKLVDHALSRVARKGMLGVIDVKGPDRPGIFRDETGMTPLTG